MLLFLGCESYPSRGNDSGVVVGEFVQVVTNCLPTTTSVSTRTSPDITTVVAAVS